MIYDAIIPENYEDKKTAEEKVWFHRPGARLFPAKDTDGFTLEIPPGISLSGRVIFRPRKARAATSVNSDEPAPSEDEIPY